MDNQNPQLPPPEDITEEYFNRFIFDASVDYPDSMYLFQFQGVRFSPLGGIQAVTGQKKNGKTFFLEMLTATALEPDSPRVRSRLQGLTVNPEAMRMKGHPLSVFYIDTEQEPINTSRFTKGVNWLCNYPSLSNHPRFHVIRLRKMKEGVDVPVERMRIIEHFIPIFNPDIIILDGIRDVVHDFNDNAESVAVINRLMSLAEERNISIWSALHYNPRPGADDQSKMRGHLGTELGNKVTDTFQSAKKKDEATGLVTFVAKQVDARGKDVPDIHYEVTTEMDDTLEIAVPKINEVKELPKFLTADDLKQLITKADIGWPATKGEVKDKAFAGYGGDKRQEFVDQAIAASIIIPTTETADKKNKKWIINPDA